MFETGDVQSCAAAKGRRVRLVRFEKISRVLRSKSCQALKNPVALRALADDVVFSPTTV